MEDREIAIDVKNLEISYRCLKSFSIRKSLFQLKKSKVEVYEAVRDVSFQDRKSVV